MLKTSSLFREAIRSGSRYLRARVIINNIVYEDDSLLSVNADLGSITGEEFAIGSAITDTVTIVFSKVIKTIVALDHVIVEIGIKREDFPTDIKKKLNVKVGQAKVGQARLNTWDIDSDEEFVPLGEFYISDHVDIDYNENKTTITCKDKMIYMENDYISNLTYPADIRDVVVEIANNSGVEIDVPCIENLSAIKIEKPVGYTYRQALSLIAQIEVGFVTFNRYGKLQIKTLQDTNFEVSMDDYYSKGFVKRGILYNVGGINCTVTKDNESKVLKVGTERGPQVTLESNIMTQEILNQMYTKLKKISFYPYTLDWIGNPALETGDLFTVHDDSGTPIKVPNLSYKLTYNGGLKAISEAETKSRTDVKTSGRPTLQQQINKVNNNIKEESNHLKNAFDEAQAKITGNRGGFLVTRLDENDKPYEFLVMDTEDINSAKNVIRLNQQGLGFSQTGYNGPFGVAITIDGHIVADYIDVGTLSANIIQSGFNDIAYGVIITQDGMYVVAPQGHYSQLAEGGMKFYTNTDELNGSISSAYSGDKTGVGIFIEPAHGFSVVRRNPGAEPNVTVFQVPDDVDELRMRKQFNLNGQILKMGGIGGFVYHNVNARSALVGWNGAALGIGLEKSDGTILAYETLSTGGTWNAERTAVSDLWIDFKSRTKFFETVDFGKNTVKNAGIYSYASGSTMFDLDGQLLLGGRWGLGLGTTNEAGAVSKKVFIQNSETQFFHNINMQGYTITNQSDIRLKVNITDANQDALKEVERLHFVNYEWDKSNPINKEKPDGKQFGIIAQDSPFLQTRTEYEESYLSVDLVKQLNITTMAVQQLKALLVEKGLI